MMRRLVAITVALALVACSKLTEENFARVQDGMTEQEVIAILGKPTESQGVNVLGVSGGAWRWSDRNAVVAVHFVNGKVALKTWGKPAQ